MPKQSSPTPKSNENNGLEGKSALLVPPHSQIELFHVEKQKEINGVEMGVLEDGTPYLTESGLARMCGIDRKVLNRMAGNWQEEKLKDRGKAIDELLVKSGYNYPTRPGRFFCACWFSLARKLNFCT